MPGPNRHPSSTSTDPAARAAERTALEGVPEIWDEVRDTAFFAMTARVLPQTTTLAMTVLLASHDHEPSPDRGGLDG